MTGFEVIAGGVPDCRSTDIRSAIVALEQSIRGSEHEIPVPPVTHHFAPGLYCREMLIPAGVTVIGKIHRHAHFNIVLSGRVAVVTEFGQEIIEAGTRWVSQPGTKRAVTAITDTVWITFHPTEETDLAKIEEHVIAPTYEALFLGADAPQRIEVKP